MIVMGDVDVNGKDEVLTREERAQAVLEVFEEIKPPSLLKWHLIFFVSGMGAGMGVTVILKLLGGR